MHMNNKLIAHETSIADAQEIKQINELDTNIASEATYIIDITKRAFQDAIPDFKDFILVYKGNHLRL